MPVGTIVWRVSTTELLASWTKRAEPPLIRGNELILAARGKHRTKEENQYGTSAISETKVQRVLHTDETVIKKNRLKIMQHQNINRYRERNTNDK